MKITKNILTYLVSWGLFLVPFIPFIVPDTMFFPFITGKGFTFRILIEILFCLFVVLASIDSQYRPKLSWITKSVLLFSLVTLIADLFGENVYKSIWSNYERMEGFVLIAHLVLYYIVLSSVFKTSSKWIQYFNTSIVASVLMSLHGVLQLTGNATINQGGVRVDATFGNASYLAIYLVFHIFLCLYMLVGQTGKDDWKKWLYALAALFEIVILYFTATRGAILGIIGGLFIAGVLVLWKERENKFLRKMSAGLVIGVLVVIVGFLGIRNSDFVKNSPVLSRFSTLGATELRSQGRYFVWPMAIKGAIESPVFGWGQENFNFVFNKYYDPRMYAQEQWFDRTHNVILDWLIAGGIVGLLSYLSMYFSLFYYVWRKKSNLKVSEKSILTGMIAAYVFHNLFVFDNLISYIMFFSFLAYIHSVSTTEDESGGNFYNKKFSDDAVNYVVAPLSIIVTVIVVYFVNVPAILANQTLIQAISTQGNPDKNLELFKKVFDYNSLGSTEAVEQVVQIASQIAGTPGADETIKNKFYEFARVKVEEKVKETPTDARYLVFAGSFLNRFAKYDDAIKYLERAIVESPKKQPIYVELGTAYLGKNNPAKAFEIFKKSYEIEKDSQEAKVIYALGALYTKNSVVFNEILTKIDQSVVINDDRFLNAYADIGDYNNVINILNLRLEKDPKNSQSKLSLASAYATIGQKQKAISLLREIIAENPDFKVEVEKYIQQLQ